MMNLKSDFPKIMSKIDEDIDEVRKLLVIDKNYDDVDSDEFDVFDPSEYNYLIYMTERLQDVLGEDKMQDVLKAFETDKEFSNFYANEIDMYGVMTNLDDKEIALKMLGIVEDLA